MKRNVQRLRLSQFVPGLLVLLFVNFSTLLWAQAPSTVTGTVLNAAGEPVVGATVTLKNTSTATTTDVNGKFSIAAPANATLVVSYVGFQNQEIKPGGKTELTISLGTAIEQLNDVVVVGYGTQKKRDLTGSVVALNMPETKKVSTNDITALLQGRASGVAVNSDGQPGSVPSVRIRGFSTLGGASPFYVVDGVPVGTSIRDFSPNDVESITVLKDAAAASIYGAAAANGVIIITTKQGKRNSEMKVDYSGYYGWDKVWQIKDVTDRQQYQTLNNESRTNAGATPFPANDPSNPGYIDSIDTDWQKEGLKTGNRQNHNISMSGGGNKSTYNVALDYFDNNGTYVGNGPDYQRYSARVNSSAEKGIFKFGETFNYTHSKENTLTFRDDILLGAIPPLIGSLVVAIPTMPVYDPALLNGFGGSNSDYNGANSLNGIGVNSVLENWVEVDRTFGNIYGELKLLDLTQHKLRFRTSLSYDKTQTRDYTWQPAFYFGKFFSKDVAQLSDNSRVFTNAAIENTLNYDLNINKHSLQVLAGQSYRENTGVLRASIATGFTTPYIPEIVNGQTKSASGTEYTSALSSYFGRINYSYDDKYLLSATLRRDGSSRFSPQNRFGYFPAVSVGWNLTNESFFNVSKEAISLLKIRASYGKLGNDNIGNYLYQGVVNTGVVSLFNGIRYVGGLQTIIASPGVKWEEKAITNVGFDGSFFNSHLDFSAEYYYAKSSDVLVGVLIPLSNGYVNSDPTVNAMTITNKGLEFSAAYHKNTGRFTFDVSANLSTVNNKVLSIGNGNDALVGVAARTYVGGEIGAHYGYVYEGIFQNQAEIDAHATQFGATLAPGDVKYKDISGPAGKPDGVVNDLDRTVLGSAIPKYNYGFNFSAAYMGFDFSVFAQGSAKFKINSRLYKDLHHSAGALNYSTDMLNRWTSSNTNTNIPRLNDADVNNFQDSDRPGWLQDGSYVRISNITLGYNLPSSAVGKAKIAKARVYLGIQNLYTFQSYYGYNPDFTSGVLNPGFDAGSYPKPRTFMVGLQLGF